MSINNEQINIHNEFEDYNVKNVANKNFNLHTSKVGSQPNVCWTVEQRIAKGGEWEKLNEIFTSVFTEKNAGQSLFLPFTFRKVIWRLNETDLKKRWNADKVKSNISSGVYSRVLQICICELCTWWAG